MLKCMVPTIEVSSRSPESKINLPNFQIADAIFLFYFHQDRISVFPCWYFLIKVIKTNKPTGSKDLSPFPCLHYNVYSK